jgi:hypothetical protein
MVDDDNTVRVRYRRPQWRHPHIRTPLLVIGAGVLALLLIVAVTAYGSRTDRAARDLRAAAERVVEKRRQVEETRQLLEKRLAELQAAQKAVAAGTDRLDAAIAQDNGKKGVTTGVAAGEVLPIGDDADVRGREALRRTGAALRGDTLRAATPLLPPLPRP